MKTADGKMRYTDVADTEKLLRLFNSFLKASEQIKNVESISSEIA